VIVEAKNCLDS